MQPDLVRTNRLGATRAARHETVAQKLEAALELFEVGVALKREQLRRAHQRASARTIERLLGEWLTDKPALDSAGGPWRRRPLPR